MNGGNCTSHDTDFTCECSDGFTGMNCEDQIERCGGKRKSLTGTIRYSSNSNSSFISTFVLNCFWEIQTVKEKVLMITFKKLEIPSSPECRRSSLTVRINS